MWNFSAEHMKYATMIMVFLLLFVEQVSMMSGGDGGSAAVMVGNNRTASIPNIKQEIDNPTTPVSQNYHQVCSPTTTLHHQDVGI